MKDSSITKEIDWFCFHLVSENLLTREQCIAVIEAIENASAPVTVPLFIQVVVENGLCKEKDRLDVLATMSEDEARVAGFPKASVFSSSPSAMPTPQRQPPPARNPLGQRKPIQENAPKAKEAAPSQLDWMKDWPVLNQATTMDRDSSLNLLNDFLHKAKEAGCSDVHISAGAYPFVRRYKEIFLVPNQEVLTLQASENLNYAPLTQDQRDIFEEHKDLDYSYSIAQDDRYRTNLLYQRLGPSGSYRIIKNRITPINELGFKIPSVVEKLTTYGQGLILITGPAGSGKSTTLSALAEHININRHDHIITVEDPIEVVYQPKGCNITQRELNSHTRSFQNALRAALREDPDVIIIGEMRDLDTIEMAIHSSETGHLVIGTLHTSSAADTMNRLLDVFPYGQQAQIRAMVAESLKGVICQQLLPNKNGDGVVLAYEIMLGTLAVSNLIREGKTFQIESSIQTGRNLGMITMEQSHFELYMEGKRSYDQTLPFIKTPELKRQMQVNEARSLGGPAPDAPQPAQQQPVKEEQPQQKKRFGWF